MRKNNGKPMDQYVAFKDGGLSKTGHTRIFTVLNPYRASEVCGEIRWHGAFKSRLQLLG
jgi:hypothetical protein